MAGGGPGASPVAVWPRAGGGMLRAAEGRAGPGGCSKPAVSGGTQRRTRRATSSEDPCWAGLASALEGAVRLIRRGGDKGMYVRCVGVGRSEGQGGRRGHLKRRVGRDESRPLCRIGPTAAPRRECPLGVSGPDTPGPTDALLRDPHFSCAVDLGFCRESMRRRILCETPYMAWSSEGRAASGDSESGWRLGLRMAARIADGDSDSGWSGPQPAAPVWTAWTACGYIACSPAGGLFSESQPGIGLRGARREPAARAAGQWT